MKIRRLCLAALFILALISISFYGGVVSYVFFYAVISIPLISLAYLLYVLLRFAVYQRIRTRNIIACEPVPYSLRLTNEGRAVFTSVAVKLHADYSSVEGIFDNQSFTLFPAERNVIETMLTCKYRGEYPVGVERLIVTDFLGIFRLNYRMPSGIEAIVRPRIRDLSNANDSPELAQFLQSHLSPEQNETDILIRDYMPGDSLKKIHWKQTAKSGALKVRTDVGQVKQKVLLMADFERVSSKMDVYLPLENQILEQAIALLYYFVRQNVPTEFLFLAEAVEKRPVHGIHQFNLLYEELALLHFREGRPFGSLYHGAADQGVLSAAPLIFAVINKLDDGLYEAFLRSAKAGKIIIVYVAGDFDAAAYARKESDRLKIVGIGSQGGK